MPRTTTFGIAIAIAIAIALSPSKYSPSIANVEPMAADRDCC